MQRGTRTGHRSAPAQPTVERLEARSMCAITLTLANDTGANRSDRLTSDPTLAFAPALSAGQRLQYVIDDGPIREALVIGGRAFVPAGVADGRHRVSARVIDAPGRPQRWSPSVVFTLDRTATAVAVRLTTDTGVSATDGVSTAEALTVTRREPGATIQYSPDDGAWTPQTAVWGTYAPRPGLNRWRVRQVDAAGNASPATTVAFDWDTARDSAIRLEGPQATTFTAAVGSEVEWVLKFAGPMHVQPLNGTLPQLKFTFRGMTLLAQYRRGSGTDRLTYSHVFTAAEAGTGELVAPTTACLCYGGSITDTAGNRMRKHALPSPSDPA